MASRPRPRYFTSGLAAHPRGGLLAASSKGRRATIRPPTPAAASAHPVPTDGAHGGHHGQPTRRSIPCKSGTWPTRGPVLRRLARRPRCARQVGTHRDMVSRPPWTCRSRPPRSSGRGASPHPRRACSRGAWWPSTRGPHTGLCRGHLFGEQFDRGTPRRRRVRLQPFVYLTAMGAGRSRGPGSTSRSKDRQLERALPGRYLGLSPCRRAGRSRSTPWRALGQRGGTSRVADTAIGWGSARRSDDPSMPWRRRGQSPGDGPGYAPSPMAAHGRDTASSASALGLVIDDLREAMRLDAVSLP